MAKVTLDGTRRDARQDQAVEPPASMPADVLAAAIAPNLERYLTGTLSLEEIAASR
ncbi:hypothetical protein [Nonomuraea sp. NPDC049480]|uniref:hypothetical protein n=1 Tax=Nonomuraea sp. NPDC049480 TaxID=3364353 RepID=UPI00378E7B30